MPVYFREPTVRLALPTVLETCFDCVSLDVMVRLVDNRSNDTLRNFLLELQETYGKDKVVVDLLDRNYGKAEAIDVAVRSTFNEYGPFEWLVSCDSDIVHQINGWPEILVKCFDAIPNAGMISPLYTHNGNNPVPPQPSHSAFQVDGVGNVVLHYGSGVAGGCFITTHYLWSVVGGYSRSVGVYGGVDGLFRLAMAKDLGRMCGYVDAFAIEHFNDKEKYADYQEWKVAVQHRIMQHGCNDAVQLGNDKGFFDAEGRS